MATYSEGDFFKAFWSAKSVIENSPEAFESAHIDLVSAIETYLKSFVWAKDNIEKGMFLYSNKGMTGNKIASCLGLKPETYRSKLSRLSDKLRSVLLNGSPVSDTMLSSDISLVKECSARVNHLNSYFNFFEEFSNDFFVKIQDYAKSEFGSFTDEDYINAIAFLAFNSVRVCNKRFDDINKDALAKVMSDLQDDSPNETFSLYKRFVSQAYKKQIVPKVDVEKLLQG